MGTEAPMRASDQDRREAVLALSDEFAEGRLDRDEFDRRQAIALEATYLHDLDPLFADLPGRVAPTSRTAPVLPTVAMRGPREGRHHRPRGIPVLAAFVLLMAILAVAVGGHSLWLLAPAVWFAVASTARRHALARAWAHQPPIRR